MDTCVDSGVDVCVTHPLVASAVKAAARETGATGQGKDSLKKASITSTGKLKKSRSTGLAQHRQPMLVCPPGLCVRLLVFKVCRRRRRCNTLPRHRCHLELSPCNTGVISGGTVAAGRWTGLDKYSSTRTCACRFVPAAPPPSPVTHLLPWTLCGLLDAGVTPTLL